MEKKKGTEQSGIEVEKGSVHIVAQIIDYVKNSVLSRTIIKKATGNITVTAFDAGEELAEKTTAFDSYIQIIDGSAEVFIDNKQFNIKLGEAIVIPAHSSHYFLASQQFKMISTVIKGGYED